MNSINNPEQYIVNLETGNPMSEWEYQKELLAERAERKLKPLPETDKRTEILMFKNSPE